MHVRLVANYHTSIVPLWSSARFRAAARAGRVSRRSCVATVAAAKQVPSPPPNHPLPRSRAPSGPAPPRVQLARPRPVCGWQLMSRSRRGAAATTPRRASPTAPRRRAPRSPRGWPRSRPARRPRLPRPTSRATVPPAPSLRQRQHVKCKGVCPVRQGGVPSSPSISEKDGRVASASQSSSTVWTMADTTAATCPTSTIAQHVQSVRHTGTQKQVVRMRTRKITCEVCSARLRLDPPWEVCLDHFLG